jgi:hypothetical protein
VAQDVIRPAVEVAAEAIMARADFAKVAATPPALAATMLATVAVEAAAPLLLGTRFPEMLRLHAKALAQHQERAERAEAETEWLRKQSRQSYTDQAQALTRCKRRAEELAASLQDALDAARRVDRPDPERLESWQAVLDRASVSGG